MAIALLILVDGYIKGLIGRDGFLRGVAYIYVLCAKSI